MPGLDVEQLQADIVEAKEKLCSGPDHPKTNDFLIRIAKIERLLKQIREIESRLDPESKALFYDVFVLGHYMPIWERNERIAKVIAACLAEKRPSQNWVIMTKSNEG